MDNPVLFHYYQGGVRSDLKVIVKIMSKWYKWYTKLFKYGDY